MRGESPETSRRRLRIRQIDGVPFLKNRYSESTQKNAPTTVRIPCRWVIGPRARIYQGGSEFRLSQKRRVRYNVGRPKSWPVHGPPRGTRYRGISQLPVGRGSGSADPADARGRHYRKRGGFGKSAAHRNRTQGAVGVRRLGCA